MNIPKIIFLICFACFVVTIKSCRKIDIIDSESKQTALLKDWLYQNGLYYKNGNMVVTLQNGKVVHGRLNWSKDTSYVYGGSQYFEVPFEFSDLGTYVSVDSISRYTSYKIVIRKTIEDTYEGALQVTMIDGSLLRNGAEMNGAVQIYRTLDNKPLNAWLQINDETKSPPIISLTNEYNMGKYRSIGINSLSNTGGKGEVMTAAPNNPNQDCITYDFYVSGWGYLGDDGVYYAVSGHWEHITVCHTVYDNGGSTGGGSGGDYPPNIPPPPNSNPPKPDPCAEAKKKAAELMKALNDPMVKLQMDKLKAYINSSKEHGFIVTQHGFEYSVTEIVEGTENSLLQSYPADVRVVMIVHIHPPGSSAIHSSTDIYGMADHMNTIGFAGNVVLQGDEMYLLSITDKDKYSKFLGTKDTYYDKDSRSGWKKNSRIERDYNSFITSFKEMYRGVDATYPTQLYLMNEYNMGVSFQKWNPAVGGFEVLKTQAKYNTNTGSSSNLSGGGSAINSLYEEIKVEVNCK